MKGMGRMDTKDIFKQAFSQLDGNYSCPDHETAFNDVLERAKNMKKENSEHNGLVEVTTDYTEPKKSAKVLHAVAGVAGAAAVLTGAVFGLKFLNDNGGLKEGGSDDIRAGYHEEISEPAQSETAVTENAIIASEDVRDKIEIDAVGKAVNGIVPMDETVELDGMTVHFTGYDYDSQFLRIEYEVKYTDGEQHHTGAPVRPIEIADTLVGDGMVIVVSQPAYRYENDLDNTIYCYADVVINGTTDYVRIPFGYAVSPEDFPAEPYTYTEDDELFAITVHCDPDSVIRTFWNDRVNIGETDREFKITDAFITPTHISARLKFDEKPTQELTDNITAGLRLKDDSRIDLTNKKTIGYTKDGDLYWLVAWYDEPIALDDIADANINGICFYGEDWEETKRMIDNYEKLRDIESSPLYTPADEWFDCDGKRVHVTGYAFDTVNLRIRYETCYDEPIKRTSSAAYFYQITNEFPDNSAGCSSADISYDRAEEGIVETLQNIYATEPVDSLEVPFGDSFFTVSYNSNIPKIEREINKEVSGSVYYRFDRFVLTPYSLSFIVTDGPTGNTEEERIYSRTVSDFEVAINLADGSTRKMQGLSDEPSGIAMPHGKAYKFYQFLDPIDINKVVTITVNGWEIYNCERALELGKEFALEDGSKGIVTSVQYDGHVCKAEMELRSTDPEYYEHKSYNSKDDPSYSIFLGAHSTITKECGSGKIEITSDENGSIIKYICFFVPLDKDDTLKLYIGDLTDHVERRAGYVEVPLTVPRHEPIKTVTENDEFGRWEITLSPMGFVIEKDGSDFFLDPKNTDCTVVLTDGREEAHTMLSTGHYDKYSSYEYTFGVFDAPLDLDNIQSVSLYGQTIVLGETSD